MDNNIIVQVSSNSQSKSTTAIAAPSNVVLQGSSDIYVVQSLNALRDTPGTTITLAEADKKTLDKLFADGTETAVIVDKGGNISVRYQLFISNFLLIVFLVSNGQGQNYIVGYQYSYNVCRCIIKYKLADIGQNETMLTADNWPNYITISSDWTKTEDMSDINLYNARELYILFYLYDDAYSLYIMCPEGLGANPNRRYYVTNYFNSSIDVNAAYYDGHMLQLVGTYTFREVYYKL